MNFFHNPQQHRRSPSQDFSDCLYFLPDRHSDFAGSLENIVVSFEHNLAKALKSWSININMFCEYPFLMFILLLETINKDFHLKKYQFDFVFVPLFVNFVKWIKNDN